MDVIGQLYSTAAFSPAKEPVVFNGKQAMRPRTGLDFVVEEGYLED
jgi:hypothetical protein